MPFPKNRKIMIYKKLFDLIVEFFNQYEKKKLNIKLWYR